MNELRFKIPENLKIDLVFEENEEYLEGKKIRKCQLVYLLAQVIDSRIWHRKEIEENEEYEFTPLSSELLSDVIHNCIFR